MRSWTKREAIVIVLFDNGGFQGVAMSALVNNSKLSIIPEIVALATVAIGSTACSDRELPEVPLVSTATPEIEISKEFLPKSSEFPEQAPLSAEDVVVDHSDHGFMVVVRNGKVHLIKPGGEVSREGFESIDYDVDIERVVGSNGKEHKVILDRTTGERSHSWDYIRFKKEGAAIQGIYIDDFCCPGMPKVYTMKLAEEFPSIE